MCGLLPIPDGRLAALASTGQVPQQAVIQQVEELEDHPELVVPVPARRVYDSVSTAARPLSRCRSTACPARQPGPTANASAGGAA